jgi:hypothetical protein
MKDAAVLTLNGQDVSDEPTMLKRGWNQAGYKGLIAKSVEEALWSIAGHFDSVWTWISDPAHANGGYWMLYDPEKPLISDLKTLEPGMGLWIDAIDDCEWDINGGGQAAPVLGHGDAGTRRRGDMLSPHRPDIPMPPDMSGQITRLDLSIQLPLKVSLLHQNYPNPFNPDTWIPYQLREDTHVVIRIYTSAGQLVQTLDLGHRQAGLYTDREKAAYWDGKNEAGEHVASGVYFCTIQAGDFTATKKMLLRK